MSPVLNELVGRGDRGAVPFLMNAVALGNSEG